MSAVFTAGNSGYGNWLVVVDGGEAKPLHQFSHPTTRLPLPWEWRPGRYGRWMVCYAMLLAALPARADLAARLAAPLADHLVRRLEQVSWELNVEELLDWVKGPVGETL
jgi:hypothetical protein